MYPDTMLVGSPEIDDIWHQHVLDTRKYHADCQHLFGFYLHHVPVIENEKASLLPYADACAMTMDAIEKVFGARPATDPARRPHAVCFYDDPATGLMRHTTAHAVCTYDEEDDDDGDIGRL
jgi:hypothetical protein